MPLLIGQNQGEVREVPKIKNIKVVTHSQGCVLTHLRLVPDPESEDLSKIVPYVPLLPHPGSGPGSLKEHLEIRRLLKGLDADSIGRRVAIILNSLLVLKISVGFANDHRGYLGQAGPRHHAP